MSGGCIAVRHERIPGANTAECRTRRDRKKNIGLLERNPEYNEALRVFAKRCFLTFLVVSAAGRQASGNTCASGADAIRNGCPGCESDGSGVAAAVQVCCRNARSPRNPCAFRADHGLPGRRNAGVAAAAHLVPPILRTADDPPRTRKSRLRRARTSNSALSNWHRAGARPIRQIVQEVLSTSTLS